MKITERFLTKELEAIEVQLQRIDLGADATYLASSTEIEALNQETKRRLALVASIKEDGKDRHQLISVLRAKIHEYNQTIQQHEQMLQEWVVDRDYMEGLLARFQKVIDQDSPVTDFKDTIFQ
ncbi:MAG UNVERIFIED_CONTAM: hypothetical protein LVT10_25835 [Anaerolineae bacterium]|jgi:hypothetical protein